MTRLDNTRRAARAHGRGRQAQPDLGSPADQGGRAPRPPKSCIRLLAAPKLVSNDLVAQMKPGSVLVDIAVDQGGCFEDTYATTHADPTYQVHQSVFYCVANMPGAVPNTSTYALTNATMPYAVALANTGWQQACRENPSLGLGLNTHAGQLTNRPVAEAVGIDAIDLQSALD